MTQGSTGTSGTAEPVLVSSTAPTQGRLAWMGGPHRSTSFEQLNQ
jgi:hypothetical protein